MGTHTCFDHLQSKMLRGVLLVCVLGAAVVVEGNRFMKGIGWSNVMQKCFGEETYLEWSSQVHRARMECYGEPMSLPEHDKAYEKEDEEMKSDKPAIVLYLPNGEELKLDYKLLREKRDNHEPLYSAELLEVMVEKVKAKVSNFTCIMKKMNYVNEDYSLNLYGQRDELDALDLDPSLKKDLLRIVEVCDDISDCKLEHSTSPMPKEIQKIVKYMECDKKLRFMACAKKDLKNYLYLFDLSGHPDKTEDEAAEGLMHLFYAFEEKDAFELF